MAFDETDLAPGFASVPAKGFWDTGETWELHFVVEVDADGGAIRDGWPRGLVPILSQH